MKTAEEILKPYQFDKAGKVNISDAINAMHEYAEQDRWVSVEERLPEIEADNYTVDVIITDGTTVSKGFLRNGKWICRDMMEKITYWKPLPAQPKK